MKTLKQTYCNAVAISVDRHAVPEFAWLKNIMQHPFRLSPIAVNLKCAMREASSIPAIPYPWDGLEQVCGRCERGLLPLIGYGSLISPQSAKRTLLHSNVDEMFPVQAYGVRRIFNYQMPVNALSQWGISPGSADSAALNVRITWSEDDTVNGVVIGIDERDVQQFRQRERGYAFMAIPYRPWADRNAVCTPSLAYILSDPEANRAKEPISPVRGYLKMCRDACRRFGEEFLDEFNRTTFLCDDKTPLLK